MKILVTSGGTKIKIDRVRDITNMSQGTFGSKIAEEYLKLKHEVVFLKAKHSKSPVSLTADFGHMKDQNKIRPEQYQEWYAKVQGFIDHYEEHVYTTYDDYFESLKFLIGVEQPDIIVLAAAVSDYGVDTYVDGKIRSNDMLTLKMIQLPKVINQIRDWAPTAKIVGFKLLVKSKPEELLAAATRTLNENKCDLVVANDLQDIVDNNHKLLLLTNTNKLEYQAKNSLDPNYLARVVVHTTFTLT